MADIRLGCTTLLHASMSENTKMVYRNAVNCFNAFRHQYALDDLWPIPVPHVAAFVSHCFQHGYAPATVTTYIASLSYLHKCRTLQDPTSSFIVRKLLEGLKRLRSRRDGRAPITNDILVQICRSLPFICFNSYESALFHATFCLAYFGLFRVGELVYTDHRQAGYALRRDDVTLMAGILTIRLRVSKTNHSGKPIYLTIKSIRDKSICPVLAVSIYLKLRPTSATNLFCHVDGSPLTRYQFAAILSKAIVQIGLPVALYKTHSFRIGRATSLAMSGVSSERIQQMGRWKSSIYRHYIRPSIQ